MWVNFRSWFPNLSSAIAFLIVAYIWAGFELYNTFGTRRFRTPDGERKDRGSYWGILLAVWGSVLAAFIMRVTGFGSLHGNAQYVGIVLMAAGILLREWSVFSLGRSFSVAVTTRPDQVLVTRGPYRWIRHPAYTGTILTLVGIALSLGTASGATVVLILVLVAFSYRVRIEEKAMLRVFGNQYREYMDNTGRFLPGL